MNLPPLLDPTFKKTTQSAHSALDALAAEGNANIQEAYNKVTAVFQQEKEEIAEVARKNQEKQKQERATLERERYLQEATLNGQARQFYVEMEKREEEEKIKNEKAATELATMKAQVEEEIRIRQAALAKQQESPARSLFPPIADPSPRPVEHSLPEPRPLSRSIEGSHIESTSRQYTPSSQLTFHLPPLPSLSAAPSTQTVRHDVFVSPAPNTVLPPLPSLPKYNSLSAQPSAQQPPLAVASNRPSTTVLPTLPSLPKIPSLPPLNKKH